MIATLVIAIVVPCTPHWYVVPTIGRTAAKLGVLRRCTDIELGA